MIYSKAASPQHYGTTRKCPSMHIFFKGDPFGTANSAAPPFSSML